MKPHRMLLPFFTLLFILSGCTALEQNQDSVLFYYQQANIAYSETDSAVIAAESRNLSADQVDLRQLLMLYFHGPTDSSLRSPFPIGTTVSKLQTRDDGTLMITLNSEPQQSQGLSWTIACTCLAKTCLHLTDADQIQIEVDGLSESTMLISRDNVILSDPIATSDETVALTESTNGGTP